jgi:hypothetical protein
MRRESAIPRNGIIWLPKLWMRHEIFLPRRRRHNNRPLPGMRGEKKGDGVNCGKCQRRLRIILGAEIPSWYAYESKRKGWCHRLCPKRRGAKKVVRVPDKGVDKAATEARKFSDPRSRVMLDGREILYKLDYKRRVREVEERDNYQCKWGKFSESTWGKDGIGLSINYTHCGAPSNGHPHHKVKRSKLRDDRASNLMAICDEHHKIAHPEHQPRFTKDAERNHRLNQELVNDQNADLDTEATEARK